MAAPVSTGPTSTSKSVPSVLPRPVPPSEHGSKYRLVFGRDGLRVVGYDNERGKGDHCHLGDTEMPYRFKDVPKLLDDFMRDVEASKLTP